MPITIRDDNRLMIHVPDRAPIVTEAVTGEVLGAVEQIRAYAQGQRDPEELAKDLALILAIEHADAEQMETLTPAVQVWQEGDPVTVGTPRLYGGSVYIAVQEHTTQADWAPPSTPALWRKHTRTTEGADVQEWVQPQGAHDAYQAGDRVTYEGKTYESTMDGNVWAPDVHGWKEVENG